MGYMKVKYTDDELRRMSQSVVMLGFDHDEYGIEHHGSGCITLYQNEIYLVCCKHTFHDKANLMKRLREEFDAMNIYFFNGEAINAKWEIVHLPEYNPNEIRDEDDLVIYKLKEALPEDYVLLYTFASILPNRYFFTYIALSRGGLVGISGYPNRFGGNTDEENHIVHQRRITRVGLISKNRYSLYLLKVDFDSSGLVDTPRSSDEFSTDGLSGGGVFTMLDDGYPCLIGMIQHGVSSSGLIHCLKSYYIERLILFLNRGIPVPGNKPLLNGGE